MRKYIQVIVTIAALGATLAAFVWIVVLPRLDWGADQKPPAIETTLARDVIGRWIRRNAGSDANPVSSTPEDLDAGRTEYQEHCAVCHALDGGGRNQLEAAFYPPIANLTGAAQRFSDAEIYFIVAKGIASTAMPAFGAHHSAGDIWHLVLWVRHLGNLTPDERAAIEQEMRKATADHEKTMEHPAPLGR
ncbi:MAG: c-type cytochrome [Candidatus Binataceae bacterium]